VQTKELLEAVRYRLDKIIDMDACAEAAYHLGEVLGREGVRQDPENDDAIILPDGRRVFVAVKLVTEDGEVIA